MPEFKVGQWVKVEFEGEISYVFGSNRKVQVRDDQGRTNSAYMEWVTLLDPADWPPQAADVWAVDGKEYHAQTGDGGVLLREVVTPEALKALNPVLVRRRGQ